VFAAIPAAIVALDMLLRKVRSPSGGDIDGFYLGDGDGCGN
jgi:hypothetical protein